MNHLSYINYHNTPLEELLKEAERTDNILAEAIYENAFEAGVEAGEQDSDIDMDKVANNVLRVVYECEWVKADTGRYILTGLNKDTNVYHNHVEVSALGGKVYKITIEYGTHGENTWEDQDEGLANMKESAKRKAVELAASGELYVD